jgi:hypothetical protein
MLLFLKGVIPFSITAMKTKETKQKLVFISILLLIVFAYPFITVANKSGLVGGFPLLFLYIFIAWSIAILLLFLVADGKQKKPNE